MSNKVILCVDDEKMILDILTRVLEGAFGDELEIEVAENADEALEVIEELVTDGLQVLIIISDWLMPGMKGDQFLIEVHSKHPEIVKILLTGQADEKAIQNAEKNANLFACIRKPWDSKQLIETIKEGLKTL